MSSYIHTHKHTHAHKLDLGLHGQYETTHKIRLLVWSQMNLHTVRYSLSTMVQHAFLALSLSLPPSIILFCSFFLTSDDAGLEFLLPRFSWQWVGCMVAHACVLYDQHREKKNTPLCWRLVIFYMVLTHFLYTHTYRNQLPITLFLFS